MNQVVGQYEILELLGTGGQGTVYRARDTRAGRTVALRVLGGMSTDPLERTRLIDGLRPYTEISHPNIATLFDIGEHEGHVYVVYEFVPGEKLSALIAGRALNLRRALDLSVQIADALAETHAFDLIHGTLTPSCIIVTPKGHAKILDLGLIACERDDARQTAVRLTERGAALGAGSVGYMSPEQVLGQKADHRTDIFAAGAILYEALTGRAAFSGSNVSELGIAVLQSAPTNPAEINPAITRDLDALVMKTLAKDPADRSQTAAGLAAALRALAEDVHSRDALIDQSTLPRGSGSGWLRGTVFALLLIAASALGVWHWQEPLRQLWHSRFGTPPVPQLVVLPFTVGGGDATRPHFGPGLAEDVARRLGELHGVTVLGRSSIRSLAGRTPESVARDVNAGASLTGVLTPSDPEWKKLTLTLSLVDPADGQTIWSGAYETPTGDIIAVESRIARDIAERLGVAFTPGAGQRRAALRIVDPQAFDFFLQAREAIAAQDASRAVQLFENAIAADASLVEAQAGLAEALYMGATFEGRLSLADVLPRMRSAASEAATADPDSASVQFALGLAAPTVRDSLTKLRGAIDIDASHIGAYSAIVDVLREIDPARSIRFIRRVIELDPLSPLARYQLAATYIVIGQFDQALIETARGQALAPSWPWWDALRARIQIARSQSAAAGSARSVRPDVDVPPAAVMRASVLLATNRTADADAVLESMTRLYPAACDAWAMLAGVRTITGDRPGAARLAKVTLGQADKASDQAPWARCAAMTAAAVGDAEAASAWISRATASDESLRMWGAVNGVLDPMAAIRQRLYPWRNVTGSPDVSASVEALDRAIVRMRGVAAKALEGLLEPAPPR